jgi:hypothetical protein
MADMATYFSDASFKFLRGLARHNDKTWFNDHKAQYEDHVRQPFLRLLTDLQPDLAAVSLHFRADPKTVGGSLFRIYRDARFSNDKSPYKSWQGARLYHERHKQVPAPSFYLHLQPGECFVGAGLWHPEPDTQRRVRQEEGRARSGVPPPVRLRGKREAGACAARIPGRLRVHRRPEAPQLRFLAFAGRRDDDRAAPAADAGRRPEDAGTVRRLPVRRAGPGILIRRTHR